MYDGSTGATIQVLALVLRWVFLAGGLIAWIALLAVDLVVGGWLALLGGALGFIGSWVLYGFGLLVEDVNALRCHVCGNEQPKKPIYTGKPF